MDAVTPGGFANYSAAQLAARVPHLSVRTARRWVASGFAPALAVAWLELTERGALAAIDIAWTDWRLFGGELHAPNGWHFTPRELLAMPLRYQELAALKREMRDSAALAKAPVFCGAAVAVYVSS